MNNWARSEGFSGLGYINIKDGEPGGPIAKNHGPEATAKLIAALGLGPNDGVFFAAGKEGQAAKLAGLARVRVGEQLDLIDTDRFDLGWIVDFPLRSEQRRVGKKGVDVVRFGWVRYCLK